MRVAVVVRALPTPTSGGMEQVTHDLATAWREAGVEVTFVTAGKVSDEASKSDFPTIYIPGGSSRMSARWSRELARKVNWGQFDVVFGVSSAARMVAKLKARPPVIMQAHGTSFDEILTKLRLFTPRALATIPRNLLWLLRDLRDIGSYDMVVAVGPQVGSTIARYPKPWRPRAIKVVSNGVPVRSAGIRKEPIRDLLFVGRLHKEKGVDLLVKAVRGTSIRLAIAGDGPQRAALMRLASHAPNIEFLGRLSAEQVAWERSLSVAAVMPSRRREGLPLAALESLAVGRPVFASDGVIRAFGDRLPAGITPLPLNVKLMRNALSRDASSIAAELPAEYQFANAVDAYVNLLESLVGGSDA